MIEKLKNCPNCAGILNDFGRCEFCGSKIYDFLTINFSDPKYPSAHTYIRIKTGNKIIIAPIVVNTVSMSMNPYGSMCPSGLLEDSYYIRRPVYHQELDINCIIPGGIYEIEDEDEAGT